MGAHLALSARPNILHTWMYIRTHISTQNMGILTHPNIPTFYPRQPTNFGRPNMAVDSHVQANFECPRVAWVAMNYVAQYREQPRNICGCTQSQSTRPQDFMGAHIL